MSEETPVHTANPFAARRLRPGFVPYVFPEGSGEASRGGEHSLAGLVARLRGNRFWGEVVGPHGSGKSALVASLVGVLEAQRHRSIVVELHDGQRRMPAHVLRAAAGQAAELLVIDGYEQLLSFVRWHVCWHCRRHGIGLVVTAHRPMGLPPLVTTPASLGRLSANCSGAFRRTSSKTTSLPLSSDTAATCARHCSSCTTCISRAAPKQSAGEHAPGLIADASIGGQRWPTGSSNVSGMFPPHIEISYSFLLPPAQMRGLT
ncbi:MAG: hypothetical protein ACOY3P_14920 [Planctomycetota bacterium]